MATGTVGRVTDRGFGFIERVGEGDMFFHASGLTGDLEFGETLVGRRVEFTIEQSGRGPRAVEIRPAD